MIELNIPLVDFREDNGPIEVWPRTHLLADFDLSDAGALQRSAEEERKQSLQRFAEHLQPVRVLMPAGSVPSSGPPDVAPWQPEPVRRPEADVVHSVQPALVPVQRRPASARGFRGLAASSAAISFALRALTVSTARSSHDRAVLTRAHPVLRAVLVCSSPSWEEQ